MRIHSNTLTTSDIRYAALTARVGIEVLESYGSRKCARAFEVKLSGSSKYAAQGGQWKAATWDEWGIFLMFLLDKDCNAICGPYKGRADFLKQTREAVERARNYERVVGRKRPGVTGPWLSPLAGEGQAAFEAATA